MTVVVEVGVDEISEGRRAPLVESLQKHYFEMEPPLFFHSKKSLLCIRGRIVWSFVKLCKVQFVNGAFSYPTKLDID